MRTQLPLLALFALSASCSEFGSYRLVTDGFRFDYGGASAERGESGALSSDTAHVRVEHRFGDVHVAPAADGEGAGWTWSVTTWADEPGAAETLAREVVLVVEESGDAVSLRLDVPRELRREFRGLESTLEVRTSALSTLDLANSFGDSSAEDVAGDGTFTIKHGDLDLVRIAGKVQLEQRFGALTAQDLGSVELTNEHGHVEINGAGPVLARTRHSSAQFSGVAGAVEVDTAHGDLEVTGADHAKVTARHGHMRLHGIGGAVIEARHGDVELRLTGGDVEVDIEHGDLAIERPADASTPHGATRVLAVHGDVALDLTAGAHADVRARFGDVVVSHPTDDSAALEASASYGKVTSALRRVQSLGPDAAGAVVHVEHGNVKTVAQ